MGKLTKAVEILQLFDYYLFIKIINTMTMKFIIYRKSLFLSFFLFYVSHLSFGQSNFSSYDISTGFSSYWPASVSASQLFRKSAEKIDYATGRATIRIPLYEIRTADFIFLRVVSQQTNWRVNWEQVGNWKLSL